MKQEQKTGGMRVAVIGLIGTLLTVCGGVTGALVTNAAAIYSLEMEDRKVSVQSSSGSDSLAVNTGEVFITRQEAAALDPQEYYVDLEQGFAMPRPQAGWGDLETLTVGEQLAEQGGQCLALCTEPVYRLTYGEAMVIESDRQTTVNGQPLPEDLLAASEALYGPPPWQVPYHDQFILNIFPRDEVQPYGIENLPDMVLMMSSASLDRVTRLVAPDEAHFALIQTTSHYANVRIDGQKASLTIDDWMYIIEADQAYYMVEISYLAQGSTPIQVWDDLQTYVNQFRVIQE